MCLSLFVLVFSSCHDHILPQHHASRTGSHDWDELHCSRWKAHQGSLGEGISYHQPRHEPLCGYCEGSGRWGHIHPAGEPDTIYTENAIVRLISKTHIQGCPGLAVSDRYHFLSKIIHHFPTLIFVLVVNMKLTTHLYYSIICDIFPSVIHQVLHQTHYRLQGILEELHNFLTYCSQDNLFSIQLCFLHETVEWNKSPWYIKMR